MMTTESLTIELENFDGIWRAELLTSEGHTLAAVGGPSRAAVLEAIADELGSEASAG